MGGGLMQLVAYGAQDIYLTGNPQITFFKVVYRRHTNFSMESIQQTFSGAGNNVVATISRNGDLVHKMYLVGPADGTAPKTILNVELEIGGQRIDRQSGQWMDTWNELSTSESKAIGLKAMTGQIGVLDTDDGGARTGVKQVHIPLQFWFCRHPGLALPLIALQYHEVKVKFTLSGNNNSTLFCDYIYLDTDERRRFAQVSHEYLIEQVQEQTAVDDKNKLNFNHPVKELIWSTATQAADVGLKLNGHDRFSTRQKEHFYLQQPYDYHTAVPRQNLPSAAQLTNSNESVNAAEAPGSLATALSSGGAAAVGAGTQSSIVAAPADPSNYQLVITNVTSDAAAANPAGSIISVDTTTGFSTKGVLSTTSDFSPEIWTAATASRRAAIQLAATAGVNFSTFAGRKVRISGANLLGGTNPTGPGILDAVILAAFTVTATDDSVAATFAIDDTSALVYFDRPVFTVATNGTSSTTITAINLFEASLEPTINPQARTSQDTKPIGVYSFALKPEEHQPSGTCNFSRIDNAELTLGGSPGGGVIYAVNYNVLRIMSGMGGLAYSN